MKKITLEQQLAESEKSKALAEKKSNDLRKAIELRDAANKPKSILDKVNGMPDVVNHPYPERDRGLNREV